jgi:hypothetical protein
MNKVKLDFLLVKEQKVIVDFIVSLLIMNKVILAKSMMEEEKESR